MDKVAVVGAGLIGRAWAMVFARAGLTVSLWDKVDGVAEGAMALIAGSLADLRAAGLVKETPEVILARITPAATLAECVAGAIHVQENGPERLAPKQELFAELDRLCPPEVVLASSDLRHPGQRVHRQPAGPRPLPGRPSGEPALSRAAGRAGRAPPWTDPAVVARTRALMDRVGQVPVVAFKETTGFVLNRLQAALVAEAFRMVRDGVMSAEDVDACVKDGLGLRWSFMGPFETIDLNAPGGVEDYVGRFGPLMGGITAEQTPYDYDAPTVGA